MTGKDLFCLKLHLFGLKFINIIALKHQARSVFYTLLALKTSHFFELNSIYLFNINYLYRVFKAKFNLRNHLLHH